MEADAKSRVGDCEIDTVIGRGHRGALVANVERVTEFTLSAQMKNKNAEAVTEASIALLKPYAAALLTITADNGKSLLITKKLLRGLGRGFISCAPTIPGSVV